jgi:hypothetical protein
MLCRWNYNLHVYRYTTPYVKNMQSIALAYNNDWNGNNERVVIMRDTVMSQWPYDLVNSTYRATGKKWVGRLMHAVVGQVRLYTSAALLQRSRDMMARPLHGAPRGSFTYRTRARKTVQNVLILCQARSCTYAYSSALTWSAFEHRELHNEIIKSYRIIIIGVIKSKWDGRDLNQTWEMYEIHTKFYLKNLKVKSHWGDLDIDGRMKLKRMLKKWGLSVTNGFIWLRIGSGAWPLWTR